MGENYKQHFFINKHNNAGNLFSRLAKNKQGAKEITRKNNFNDFKQKKLIECNRRADVVNEK